MQYEFKEVRVGDIRLAYVEQGHGVPVIFVHGAGAIDLRTWEPQLEFFAEQFRVIAYSRRYHYPNAWSGDGSDIDSMPVDADDLAALIRALDLGRAHLIGHSYGAEIVLRLAVEHPDMIRTLVVEEPALVSWLVTLPGASETVAEFAAAMLPAKNAVQNGDLEEGVRLFVDAAVGRGLFEQLPASVKDRLMDNVRLLSATPTEVSEFDTAITRGDAATIEAPTLILTGDQSSEMFLLASQELAHHVSHAERAQIEGASHLLHGMNPQAYNATVLAFLANHTS